MKEIRCPVCGFYHDKLAEVVPLKEVIIEPNFHDLDGFPYTVKRRTFNALCPKTLSKIHLIIEEYTDDKKEFHKKYHIFKGVMKP